MKKDEDGASWISQNSSGKRMDKNWRWDPKMMKDIQT